jgi:hypothetical protein
MKVTIIKPKTRITMKSNNFTFSILPFFPSPFFPAAVAQEFPVDICNPFIPNEPNFQTTGQTITLVMERIYNEKTACQPKNTNPKRTKNERKRAKFHPKNNPHKPNFKITSIPQFPLFSARFFCIIALGVSIITGCFTENNGMKGAGCVFAAKSLLPLRHVGLPDQSPPFLPL